MSPKLSFRLKDIIPSGESLDEMSRRRYQTYAEPVFPLVERPWTRANCIDWLQGKVPHETPRSACVFCPFHNDAEWQRIKDNDPGGWARAIEIDTALRSGAVAARDMRQTMYLHRSCQPLTQIDFRPRVNTKELQLGFGVECEGVCGV